MKLAGRPRLQKRQRSDVLPQRDFERRDRRAFGGDQRLLLRHIELRCRTAGELLLDKCQDALGGGEVAPRDAQLVLRGQHLEVGVGDGDQRRQRHHLAVIADDRRAFLGCIQRSAVLAPEVDHVARGEAEIVSRESRAADANVGHRTAAGRRGGDLLLLGRRRSRDRWK